MISGSWFGIFVPAGMPEETQQQIEEAFLRIAGDPATQEEVAKLGLVPDHQERKAFQAFIDSETQKWGEVIRTQNIRIQ